MEDWTPKAILGSKEKADLVAAIEEAKAQRLAERAAGQGPPAVSTDPDSDAQLHEAYRAAVRAADEAYHAGMRAALTQRERNAVWQAREDAYRLAAEKFPVPPVRPRRGRPPL